MAFQSCGKDGEVLRLLPMFSHWLRIIKGDSWETLHGSESAFPWRLHRSCHHHCLLLNMVCGWRRLQSEGSGGSNERTSLTWSKRFGEGVCASATPGVQSAGQGAMEGLITEAGACCWRTPLWECHRAPLGPPAPSAHRSAGIALDRSYCSKGPIRKAKGNTSGSGVAIWLSLLIKLSKKSEHFLLLARVLLHTTLGLTLAPTSLLPSAALLPQICSCALLDPSRCVRPNGCVLHRPSKSGCWCHTVMIHHRHTCVIRCPTSAAVGERKQLCCVE